VSAPDRDALAAAARRITADLELLRAAVEARSGADAARTLHTHAAAGVHQMIAATGVYRG
jgi:hypothetical protein